MTKLVKEMLLADIDWTKEDVVLVTKSGVEHTHKEEGKELSSNRVKLYQDAWKTPYYITQKDNYLSIKAYVCPYHYRVSDFTGIPADKCHLMDRCLGSYYYTSYPMSVHAEPYTDKVMYVKASEIRIYHDRRIASIAYGDIGVRGERFDWGRYSDENQVLSVINKKDTFIVNPGIYDSKICKVITTEEEIEANAVVPTKDNIHNLTIGFTGTYSDACDLRDHAEIWGRHGENNDFHKDTKEIIKNFFNLTAPENKELYTAYLRGRRSSNIDNIADLRHLLLASIKCNKMFDGKEQKMIDLVANFKEDFDNLKFQQTKNIAHWYRIGDEIVLMYKGCHAPYSYDNKLTFVFSYNVKTKKRFCGEYNGTIWKFNIPSYQYITNMCEFNNLYKYRTTQPIIHCEGGVRELFANTNMIYLLDNASDEQVIQHCDVISVKDLFTDNNIDDFVFAVIFSTGVPVLEQFLKSGLYNLYFQGLESWDDYWLYANDSKVSSKTEEGFVSVDESDHYYSYHLEYLKRQKNLKKMFGMTMEQLRILNDKYSITTRHDGYYTREDISLIGAEKVLGVSLSDLDKDTFIAVLDFSLKHNEKFTNWSTQTVLDVMVNMTPKQRIKFLTDLTESDVQQYLIRDYFNMRSQLQTIQKLHPETLGIWNEKEYPAFPKACKRFVPYREGVDDPIVGRMTHGWYGGYHYGTQQKSTIEAYKDYFEKAARRGDIKPVWADETQKVLLGMLLNLTPGENIRFLHDEASHWVTFYQDEVKQADLEKAVKRVSDLAWKDEKLGLEIITPTSIADLKKEGTILSHCVASYVDAIIADKSNIVFLRRSDMIDAPFFTIEILDDGSIRQVHCYRNGSLTEQAQKQAYEYSQMPVYDKTFDIVKFLQGWAKAKKGRIKASTIQTQYGALCARG